MQANATGTTVLPVIDKLRAAGVALGDCGLAELRTVDPFCIAGSAKTAWLSDGEGNSLCIDEGIA